MSSDAVTDISRSGSFNEATIAVLGLIAGSVLVAKREKALAGIGLATFSILLLLISYSYIIPEYLAPLSHPQFLHGLTAVLIAVIGVVAVYKLASGAVYMLSVALTAPLTYQLMSVMWQLSPSEKWDQVKLFVSLFAGLVLSLLFVQNLEGTSKLASVVLGSLLIAAAVQYLYEDESYVGGIQKCLGSPKEGWDASECSPFYFTWLGIIAVTGLWALATYFAKERRPASPREIIIHAEEAPYFRLEEQAPRRSTWERIKSGGRSVKEFLGEKFSEAPPAEVPPQPHREERIP